MQISSLKESIIANTLADCISLQVNCILFVYEPSIQKFTKKYKFTTVYNIAYTKIVCIQGRYTYVNYYF